MNSCLPPASPASTARARRSRTAPAAYWMPSSGADAAPGAMSEHPLLAGLLRGDRRALAQAITLVESSRAEDRGEIGPLLAQIRPHAGHALRLGITGPPGAGKSTFI